MIAPTTTGLAQELAAAVDELRRVTVRVQANGAAGSGAGVLWDPPGREGNEGDDARGLVITNAHVATRAQATIRFSDGVVVRARVVARDRKRDLAALQPERHPAAGFAQVRDEPPLRVGELVITIGHPGELSGAATLGIVHTVGGDRAGSTPRWIQADLRLAPGFSGGPLADSNGRLIGINTMMQRGGLALAVPVALVQSWLRRTLAPAAP